jgi:hypothetical protein
MMDRDSLQNARILFHVDEEISLQGYILKLFSYYFNIFYTVSYETFIEENLFSFTALQIFIYLNYTLL